jgi:molybdopterin synthase sulfur carrier subunit
LVKLKVLYFASIRETVGTASEDVDLPAGASTVSDLKKYLQKRGGAWSEALADGKLLRMAVNQDMAQPGAAIKAGDEVAFFPPVTGG